MLSGLSNQIFAQSHKQSNVQPENSTTDKPVDYRFFTRNIVVGVAQTKLYLPDLQNKKVALVVNQTSTIGKSHLVDSLLKLKIDVVKIFAPEHGFRGDADAGEELKNGVDEKTNLPIVSLYGDHKKPTVADLKDIDVIVFDIQDVGARFYTYISTLHFLMQAAAENDKQLIIFDRPNPNGHFVDGPILEIKNKSFVGMHPVPVAHGMTIGEYAQMLNGENWLDENGKHLHCNLKIIPCKNYNHHTFYRLPIKPSPNLPNMKSIYLYPSICFFEGTALSLGRGTNKPFQQFGHPDLKMYEYSFTPKSKEGARNPPLLNQPCFGKDLSIKPIDSLQLMAKIDLSYLMEAYKNFPQKEKFFNNFFLSLAGTEKLRKQIEQGLSADKIRASWQNGIAEFKKIRKKYLLYEE